MGILEKQKQLREQKKKNHDNFSTCQWCGAKTIDNTFQHGSRRVVEFIVARRIVDSLLYFNMKRRENKYDTSMQKLHS